MGFLDGNEVTEFISVGSFERDVLNETAIKKMKICIL